MHGKGGKGHAMIRDGRLKRVKPGRILHKRFGVAMRDAGISAAADFHRRNTRLRQVGERILK
jgi:hypothetical protein